MSKSKSLLRALSSLSPGTEVHIYTDGSHSKVPGGYLGYGAYCDLDGTSYRFSDTINPHKLSQYQINPKTIVSNPTAEFLALAEVLKKLSSLHNSVKLIFWIDYIGVGKWISGEWRAKKIYIQRIKNHVKRIISKADFKVEIRHVRGHSGVVGNTEADLMAKREEPLDEFS